MRIDLFLKVSGLLKTRSIAGKAISAGAVQIDGGTVKASTPVSEGSVITLVQPHGATIKVRVVSVPETKSVPRKERTSLYEVIERSEPPCF